MSQTVKSKILHGVAWNLTEKFLIRGVSLLLGIILARLLSPSDFGLLGMLAIFIAISNVFIDGGLTRALIQRQNCSDIDYSTAFVSNMGVSLIIYILLFFTAPLIAAFYYEPILTPLTRVISLNFILSAFNIVQRAKLMSAVDFKSLAQLNVISVIISGVVGIVMAYWGYGVWSLVGQSLIATIVLVVLFPFYSKWKPSIRFSKDSFGKLFGFGSKLMITGIVSVIMNNLSTIFIGRYYKSHQLGYYTRATQTSEMFATTIYEVLGNVTFPVLSGLQNDRGRLVFVYRRSLYYTTLIVFPLMILLTLVARPMVLILLTEKWLPCVVMMQWLFLARIFYPLSAINLNILNATGRSDLFMKLDFSKIPLTLITLAITIPISVEAITIGYFVLSFVCFFVNAYLPGRIFGYGAWAQIKDWKGILLSVAIMACAVFCFMHLFSNEWIQLFGGGTIGVVVYLLCCFAFKVIDKDIFKILKIKKYDKTQNNTTSQTP